MLPLRVIAPLLAPTSTPVYVLPCHTAVHVTTSTCYCSRCRRRSRRLHHHGELCAQRDSGPENLGGDRSTGPRCGGASELRAEPSRPRTRPRRVEFRDR